METYFCNIDLESIKENENAGSTQTTRFISQSTSFKSETLPQGLIDGENCVLDSYTVLEEGIRDIKGTITDKSLLEKIVSREIKVDEISVNCEYQTFHHLPTPKYSYSYESIAVQCKNCGSEIMSDELRSDESYDGEIERYSTEVCPVCGQFDCCQIEYESIESSLERLK